MRSHKQGKVTNMSEEKLQDGEKKQEKNMAGGRNSEKPV